MSFKAIVADPPWLFSDRLPGKTRGAEKHYDVLSVTDIAHFAIPPTEPDAWLFLWRVSSQVEEAYFVCRAWGFTPKSEIVWEKTTVTGKPHFGMGHYVRASHESCIVAVKGRPKPVNKGVRSRFSAPTGRHSAKPDEFYDIVDRIVGPGPKAEMFARRKRPVTGVFNPEFSELIVNGMLDERTRAQYDRAIRNGWTAFGNEVP